MTVYAWERLTADDTTPVGFSNNILNPSSLVRPKFAFGRVEGATIRASTQFNLEQGEGYPIFVNEVIPLNTEQDIENFRMICAEPGKSASVYFEISKDE